MASEAYLSTTYLESVAETERRYAERWRRDGEPEAARDHFERASILAELASYVRNIASGPSIETVVEVSLLFHSTSPWTMDKQRRWHELTGTNEATYRALCDWLRAVPRAVQPPGMLA